MKTEKIETFDDADDILVDKLNKIGYTRPVSKSLVFFLSHEKGKSHDIEKVTSMRQPEVSTSMNYLKSLNLVTVQTIMPIGKGRPTFLYTRKGCKDTIIDCIIARIKEDKTLLEDAINALEKNKS